MPKNYKQYLVMQLSALLFLLLAFILFAFVGTGAAWLAMYAGFPVLLLLWTLYAAWDARERWPQRSFLMRLLALLSFERS